MVGVPVGLALLARRNAVAAAVAGAVVAVAIAAVGWERQDDYLENRYTRSEDFRFQLDEAARWAKPTRDLRIGIAGTSGAYSQYVLYGDELTNHVQYIGRELPAGDFRSLGDGRGSAGDAGTCPRFRRALNEGDYDYVVTTPELDLNDPGTAKPSPERGWIANSDAVREVLQEGRVGIYEITGPVPPDACRTDREGPSPDGEGGTGSGKDGGPGKRSEERQG